MAYLCFSWYLESVSALLSLSISTQQKFSFPPARRTAFLYSGLSRRKSALQLVWAVAASNAVVIFQWWFWGYSLAFSSTATNGFIGNLRSFALRKVLGDPSPGSPLIPELLYSFYQMEFACVTVAILMGALAERGRVFPAMVFTFIWMTIVYCPIACWAWSTNGWAFKWGVLDYAGELSARFPRPSVLMLLLNAGGGPVEIASGISGLAYSWVLGRRSERELRNFRPHNVSLVALGTFVLWFGWLGFNGGSAFGANLRAIMAIWNSMIAGAMSGIVWCLLDYRIERKWSMVGFCSGTIAGLVVATPASGYVPQWAALVLGIIVGAVSNYSTKRMSRHRVSLYHCRLTSMIHSQVLPPGGRRARYVSRRHTTSALLTYCAPMQIYAQSMLSAV